MEGELRSGVPTNFPEKGECRHYSETSSRKKPASGGALVNRKLIHELFHPGIVLSKCPSGAKDQLLSSLEVVGQSVRSERAFAVW